MAFTTINKSTDYFKSVRYQGTGNDNLAVTGVGFSSDFTWTKKLETTTNERPYLFDTIRGATKYISTSHADAEQTATNSLKAWTSDGYTAGTNNAVNQSSSYSYTTMNWKAGTAVSGNTSGSGTYKTYTGTVNTTSGFSIIKYTGNGSAGHTIPHHLGTANIGSIFVKNLDSGSDYWYSYHKPLGATKTLILNETDAVGTNTMWNNTAPTSSVFSVGSSSGSNTNNQNYIAYIFADIQGYCKTGQYTSNGNVDGVFQYLGFKPAVLLVKNTSQATDWIMFSNDRNGYNGNNTPIFPNTETGAGNATDNAIDLLSNGFKVRTAGSKLNGDGAGQTLIYMALGQTLVGTNNVPNNAR